MPSLLARAAGGRRASTGAPLTHKHVASKVKVKTSVFGWPGALHFHGSVIPNVALPVLIFTLWAFLVWLLAFLAFSSVSALSMPPTFITIISLVLSLLLVFRTNTAYERYNEGRKLWGTLIVTARNLTRLIWCSVEEHNVRDTREKIAALNLVLAFFVATRNHLRAEYGLKDAQGNWRTELVSLIPRKRRDELAARAAMSAEQLPVSGPEEAGELAAAEGANEGGPATRLRLRSHTAGTGSGVPQNHVAVPVDDEPAHAHAIGNERSSIPVDVSHLLSAYIITQRKRERIDVPQFGVMTTLVSSLVDTLTNLERILTSPIPLAYSVHLKQALYIYLLMLPFQLIQTFKALSILIVFLAAFTLLGVESVGGEIEQPFGYDLNDLPLDRFVEEMRAEIRAVVQSEPIDLAEWDLNVLTGSGSPGSSTGGSARAFHRSGISAYDRLMASSMERIGGNNGSGSNSPMGSLARIVGRSS